MLPVGVVAQQKPTITKTQVPVERRVTLELCFFLYSEIFPYQLKQHIYLSVNNPKFCAGKF